MTLDSSRRLPWSMLLSVAAHGVVVARPLYTSVHQAVEQPSPTQPIKITMAAPVDLESPPAARPVVKPVVEPDPKPEPEVMLGPPKETPVVICEPEPKPKSEPKPKPRLEKKIKQPGWDVKPAAESHPASPFENNNTMPVCIAPSTSTAAAKPIVAASSGPRAVSRAQPTYPARTQALRVEGTVRVKFDVTPSGRIDNLQIFSAQSTSMFEREVKSAMRGWCYEQVRPGTDVTMTIRFRLNGIEIN